MTPNDPDSASDGGFDNSEDGDRTVIRPVKRPPPPPPPSLPSSVTQTIKRSDDADSTLEVGTLLDEFEITQPIGEGGFSFVYLAQDHSLGRRVALKEYMPMSLATRSNNTQITVKSERYRETFEAGMKSFINEARLLAQFDHPSLVKVYRFWEANGTAYMVMPFYEGITVKTRLAQLGEPPDEAWLMGLLGPVTEALEVIHAESCYHRDIAPDNIMLLGASGRPLLLDFGAARRVIGDMTQALTVILKPGYAPVEQYGASPSMKQGPWTDVYALCAVVYQAIAGKTPPPSVGRMLGDSYEPLETIGAGRYSERLLRAIDHGLRVRPEDRTQSVAQLRADLGLAGEGIDTPEAPSLSRTAAPPLVAPTTAPAPPMSAFDAAARTAASATAAVPKPLPPRPMPVPPTGPAPAPVDAGSAAGAPDKSGKTGLWAGLGVLGLAAVGVGAYMAFGSSAPAPQAATPAASTVVQADKAPAAQPDASAAVPAASAVVAAPAPEPAPPPPAPFTVAGEFQRVVQAQTPGFTVEATPSKTAYRIGRDSLSFKVKSNRDGHVYVLMLGPDQSLVLLFPNTTASNNRISADRELSLPQASWPLVTADPPGPESFLVIVSSQPRDFSALSRDRDRAAYGILKLPTGSAGAALAAAHTGGGSAFAGRAVCKTEPCVDEYAATQFTVDVVR